MPDVADGPVQGDHVASHHVEAKFLDAVLHGILVLWAQDEGLGPLSWPPGDPLGLRLPWLKVPQRALLQHRGRVGVSVGLEGHVLLLDDLEVVEEVLLLHTTHNCSFTHVVFVTFTCTFTVPSPGSGSCSVEAGRHVGQLHSYV